MRGGTAAVTIGTMNQTSDQAGEAPPTAPATRRLYRSVRDRRVAGVAGGLGAYTNVDPVVFRLAFVLLTFVGGIGPIAYLVAWLVVPPEDPDPEADAPPAWLARPEGVSTAALVVGGVLIAIGLATLVDAPGLDVIWPFSWPVVLIAAGLAVLIGSRRSRRGPGADPLGASPPPPAPPAPAPPPPPATPARPASGDATPPAASGDAGPPATLARYVPHEVDEVTEAELVEGEVVDAEVLDAALTDEGGEAQPIDEGRGPGAAARPWMISATTLTVGVLFVAGGLATLGHLLDWWTLTLVGLLGGALLICGLGLVASAWLGRGRLLIPLGILLAIGTILAAIVDVPLRGGIGDRDYTVTEAADLRDEYRLAIGSLELDLSRLQLDGDAEVEASVGLGDLLIEVPDGVRVVVDAEAGMGQAVTETGRGVMQLGRRESGVGVEIVETLEPPLTDEATPTLRVEARTGIGEITIRQSGRALQPAA
jgi:phage shock protein PspC (stress-responsive transcriptional regulator)